MQATVEALHRAEAQNDTKSTTNACGVTPTGRAPDLYSCCAFRVGISAILGLHRWINILLSMEIQNGPNGTKSAAKYI